MVAILLIEDDEPVRRGLRIALGRHGYDVRTAANGAEGLRAIQESPPDLVALDVMLPDVDGVEVCRRIRSFSQLPVIMVTARDDDLDVVQGLEAGADDYVVKPARPSVLDARIRAVLRRTSGPADGVRSFGDLRIDTTALTVTTRGEVVALTPTELRLLLTLSRVPGRVLSRQQLLEDVWEHDYLGDSRLVDNGVQRLRAKIEADAASPRYVQTVRGFGYRFGPL
ncbi:response regulator [Cryptosporangium sp. NPDC048952]|uniref:response regulator n=1 Tax=Cryptosporangium sp. NPDC048952 TaxID=3363961 RepID=UPI003714745F